MRQYVRLLRFLRPHLPLFLLSFLFILLLSLTSAVSLGTLSPVLKVLFGHDTALPVSGSGFLEGVKETLNRLILDYPPQGAAVRLAVVLAVIFFLRGIFLYVQRFLSRVVEEATLRDVRNALFQKVLWLPLTLLEGMRSGELASRFINDVNMLRGALNRGLSVILREGITGLAFLVVAALASWRLTLVALVLVPGFWVFMAKLGRKLKKRSRRTLFEMSEVSQHLTETIGGIKVIKGFGTEDREDAGFREKTHRFFKSYLRFESLGLLSPSLSEFVTAVLAATLLILGARLIFVQEALSADRFFVFIAAILSTTSPIKRLTQSFVQLQHGLAAARRTFEILDMPDGHEGRRGGRSFECISDRIEFGSVSFEYEPGIPVLRDINLIIPQGKAVALVGPSGAGKSTLSDLLAGFHVPTEGQVTLDGIALCDYDLRTYRSRLALVPQDPFLFTGSVYENIAYARPEASHEEVFRAAEAAQARVFIEGMEKGWDTQVGERGVRLSGGERQRIVLARAILRDPEVLIMDEATSSLDSESEEAVKRAMAELLQHRTTLVIAHRLSTVLEADRIVVLDKGRILDQGEHTELLRRCPLYRRLCELQFGVREGVW
jgi:subfamily B ATP-binding cassette protein MsbA